jgi:ParB family transcriptional regulator, chromosome partitioning protein
MEKMNDKLVMFPLAACVIAGNIRVTVDEQEIRLLGESLKKRQIHPIFVLADGTVIDGSKRVRAALAAGLTELLAVVSDEPLTPEQIRELQLISAFHRSDPSPFDKWQAMEAVKASHPDWSNKQLADLLDIDPKMIKVLLSPGGCIEAARDSLRKGEIGISVAHELSLLPPEEQQPLLDLKLGGGSRDDVAQLGRERRNGNGTVPSVAKDGREAPKLVELEIPLPGGRAVVIKGEDTLPAVLELLKKLSKEVEAAVGKNLTAKKFQKKMRHLSEAANIESATDTATAAI